MPLPIGRYIISNIAHSQFVGLPPILPPKLPIVISGRQIVSPGFAASSYIDHSNL